MRHLRILDESGRPLPVESLDVWLAWMAEANRLIAETTLPDGLVIQTKFTGIDGSFGGSTGLFETANILHSSTVEEALAFHEATVDKAIPKPAIPAPMPEQKGVGITDDALLLLLMAAQNHLVKKESQASERSDKSDKSDKSGSAALSRSW